jgi:hypothetical protein
MYHVYSERVTERFPAVTALRDTDRDAFVAETAEWVARRVA